MHTITNPVKHYIIKNGIFCLITLLLALGLKHHYSKASSDALTWILSPTAAIVEILTGNQFIKEADAGFFNQDTRIMIAPACAGVNFLIAAFCVSVFTSIHKLPGVLSKSLWLLLCATASFIYTILVNTIRIITSIRLITADIHFGWFSLERIHRLDGIIIYFFFLSLLYFIIQKITTDWKGTNKTSPPVISRTHHRISLELTGLVPLIFYWAITIVQPWLNHAYRNNPSGFIEHSTMVVAGSITIFFCIYFFRRIAAAFLHKPSTGQKII